MATPFSVREKAVIEPVDGYEIIPLGATDRMSIGHMHFEPGTAIPEHHHPNHQIGFIYRGELTFHAHDETYILGPGDGYTLRANEPHYGENQSDDPVDGIYVHTPPRDPPAWDE